MTSILKRLVHSWVTPIQIRLVRYIQSRISSGSNGVPQIALSTQAWERLIGRTFSPNEVASLIGTTFTNEENKVETIDNLHGDERPPSRTGAPEHPESSNLRQHNPRGPGRRASGPPTISPKLQQKGATSRSSVPEQDPRTHKRQPCATCQQANCRNGNLCRSDHTSSSSVNLSDYLDLEVGY